MFFRSNNLNKTQLIEQLNEILSLENAVLERLHRRSQETAGQSSHNLLQQQLQEEKEQQNRLRKLIADYGGKQTGSKADLLSLNSLTDETMDAMKKKNNAIDHTITNSESDDGGNESNMKINNNISSLTLQEKEVLNAKEDALIKNTEMLAYERTLKVAKKMNDEDATHVLKQNLQEKRSAYHRIRDTESKMFSELSNNNDGHLHEYFNLGRSVADMLTSYWNSKENPSKVYIFNRRVHHGTIGALLGLSSLYKNNPLVTGILSGLGAGLQKDDYNDFKEWFLFKKKEDETKEDK